MFAVVRWSTASCCGVNTSWLTSSYRFAGCLAATSLPTRFPPPPVTSPSSTGLNQKPSTQQAGQAVEKGPQSQPLHRPPQGLGAGQQEPSPACVSPCLPVRARPPAPPGHLLPGDCPGEKPDLHAGLLAQAFLRALEVLELEGERGLDRGAVGQDELATHAGPQWHCRAKVQAELLLVAWLCAGDTAPCPRAPGYTPPLALPSEPLWEGARARSSNQASHPDPHLIKLPPHRHLRVSLGCPGRPHISPARPGPGRTGLSPSC